MAVATPIYERQAGRRKLAKKKQALSDGSFPIPNTSYLRKAIRAVGRAAPGKRPVLARLIRKRARQLGSAGAAILKGSWADPSKNTKQMARALHQLAIELNYTSEQAREFVTETVQAFKVVELTTVAASTDGPQVTSLAAGKKKYDPDNDGDDDASPSSDTDKDYAGKLGPRGRKAMRAALARKMSPAAAYKVGCQADKMGSKAA